MGTIEALSLAMGTAWTSGINLYATVAALGIAGRTEMIQLPPELQVLTHPAVIIVACIMYVIEFFADKVPYVDSGWDVVHTFIRVPAGAILAAKALGPMQFTNRRGNGTYSLVVRRCPGAKLDPVFERGATNLLNAMKAAICLLDMELAQMRPDIREAYQENPVVLGIFPVAAYNGGPRNVTKLYGVLKRMKVPLDELSRPPEEPIDHPVKCPCVWKADGMDVRPVAIPRYNNENRWYIEKYQSIVSLFE